MSDRLYVGTRCPRWADVCVGLNRRNWRRAARKFARYSGPYKIAADTEQLRMEFLEHIRSLWERDKLEGRIFSDLSWIEELEK
jgi:hypothetical protein